MLMKLSELQAAYWSFDPLFGPALSGTLVDLWRQNCARSFSCCNPTLLPRRSHISSAPLSSPWSASFPDVSEPKTQDPTADSRASEFRCEQQPALRCFIPARPTEMSNGLQEPHCYHGTAVSRRTEELLRQSRDSRRMSH
ncbi:hypothetical protein PBY51_012630 [Eleginops maclovinus]|uniref:Uncharacterized protein n=1 Tax=Eleginops maclovinus TaxID=56733 RepID=A0AAN7Y3D7_ELEMC|nr:hypothetical protein PBY51_012630 [Eleginops maclovinus]